MEILTSGVQLQPKQPRTVPPLRNGVSGACIQGRKHDMYNGPNYYKQGLTKGEILASMDCTGGGNESEADAARGGTFAWNPTRKRWQDHINYQVEIPIQQEHNRVIMDLSQYYPYPHYWYRFRPEYQTYPNRWAGMTGSGYVAGYPTYNESPLLEHMKPSPIEDSADNMSSRTMRMILVVIALIIILMYIVRRSKH